MLSFLIFSACHLLYHDSCMRDYCTTLKHSSLDILGTYRQLRHVFLLFSLVVVESRNCLAGMVGP